MKTVVFLAASLLAAASFGNEARALNAAQAPAPAVERTAKPAADTVRRHRRPRGGLFRNWCAYNCYAVPRCHCGYSARCACGRYGYSRFAYDEDLPFCYRYDRDASPIDNGDAYLYRFTGAPVMRFFERIY